MERDRRFVQDDGWQDERLLDDTRYWRWQIEEQQAAIDHSVWNAEFWRDEAALTRQESTRLKAQARAATMRANARLLRAQTRLMRARVAALRTAVRKA